MLLSVGNANKEVNMESDPFDPGRNAEVLDDLCAGRVAALLYAIFNGPEEPLL